MRLGVPLDGRRLAPLALLAFFGCKGASAEISLSKTASPEGDESIPVVPVPPEDGPKLFAYKPGVTVRERPAKDGRAIGELRVGAPIARAAEPFKLTEDCPGGYYPVRPRGFVCMDDGASFEGGPVVGEPQLERPLPYRYATARMPTPIYARMPNANEQTESEPNLERYLTKAAKRSGSSLRAGANDVPLDERGVAVGLPVMTGGSEGVNEEGRRTQGSYFDFGSELPPPVRRDLVAGPLVTTVLRKGSGVPITGTVMGTGPQGDRRFGILPDGTLVPTDKLDAALGSTFHGVDLTKDKTLPIGFTLRHEVVPYALGKGKADKIEDEELERRSVVNLTGRFRTVDNHRYEEATDGTWFRERDLTKIVKRSKFPDFVAEGVKWVDVSLALQTMTLYQGRTAIYATLISSGQDVVGDPSTTASTLQGNFKIERKATSFPLHPLEVHQAFDVVDAPWTLEFSPGYAFMASYWSDSSGEARMFHNVALSPIDARRLFVWSGAPVPAGWAWVAPTDEDQITVHVRK